MFNIWNDKEACQTADILDKMMVGDFRPTTIDRDWGHYMRQVWIAVKSHLAFHFPSIDCWGPRAAQCCM